jgi:shikimate dehydrogenase
MSTHQSPGSKTRFAVIGNPVEHSRSPLIHRKFAEQLGIHLVYDKLPASKDNFAQTVSRFFDQGGAGLNITVPFKGDAYTLCDVTGREVETAGVVNTISLQDGKVTGFNTDGSGLVKDIKSNLGQSIRGSRVLLLGAGGAIRGVIGPLMGEQPAAVTIVNRTRERAMDLAVLYSGLGKLNDMDYDELEDERFDFIINGTSASLEGHNLPLPQGIFGDTRLAYDMMYGPAASQFMEFALGGGAQQVADGLGMLVEQAADSFRIWHGVRPDTQAVREFLQSGPQA